MNVGSDSQCRRVLESGSSPSALCIPDVSGSASLSTADASREQDPSEAASLEEFLKDLASCCDGVSEGVGPSVGITSNSTCAAGEVSRFLSGACVSGSSSAATLPSLDVSLCQHNSRKRPRERQQERAAVMAEDVVGRGLGENTADICCY